MIEWNCPSCDRQSRGAQAPTWEDRFCGQCRTPLEEFTNAELEREMVRRGYTLARGRSAA